MGRRPHPRIHTVWRNGFNPQLVLGIMDEEAVGLIAWIVIGIVGLVAAIGVAGGVMYANDTTVGATVTQTQCSVGDVSIETKFPVPGITHTVQQVPFEQCNLLDPGKSFVEYRIKSGRTTLYEDDSKERCLYDSETGIYCGEARPGLPGAIRT